MKFHLRTLADRAGDLLDCYLQVDHQIARKSGTFRSLFGRVPFDELLEQARALQPTFTSFVSEISRFHEENRRALSKDQKAFLSALDTYVNALLDAVNSLIGRQHAALQASRSLATSRLTWQEFQRLQADYEACIRRYSLAGATLQEYAQRVLV